MRFGSVVGVFCRVPRAVHYLKQDLPSLLVRQRQIGVAEVVGDDLFRIAGADGGYVLSSACSGAPRTPRENVEALVRAAVEAA